MIKILIVDDSAFMRRVLSDLFAGAPGFTVLDTARNGMDAVDKVKRLRPDIVTMDVEMPVLDGIEALSLIMRNTPTPVVMVSSLTRDGAEATIRALSLGAVDFVAKTAGPISSIEDIKEELLEKCRAAARARLFGARPRARTIRPGPAACVYRGAGAAGRADKLVVLGTSTGGPRALQEVIAELPASLPCGVVVVQHMPPGFTRSLAERLDSLSAVTVKEARDGDAVEAGVVLIAPGSHHIVLENRAGQKIAALKQTPPVGGHRPSVDVLFESAAQYGKNVVAVVLTGMGRDGTAGTRLIKQSGGYAIAEDQSTAVVYGMPKSIVENGLADRIVPLGSVAAAIVQAVTK